MGGQRLFAVLLAYLGLMCWIFPGFNGILFEPSDVSAEGGRIVGAIFLVGAGLLWFR